MSEQHQAIATVLCFNTPIPCSSEPTYVNSKMLPRFLLRLGVNQSRIADRQKHPILSCTDIPLYSHGGTLMSCHLF
jgi:hypothetical protein